MVRSEERAARIECCEEGVDIYCVVWCGVSKEGKERVGGDTYGLGNLVGLGLRHLMRLLDNRITLRG